MNVIFQAFLVDSVQAENLVKQKIWQCQVSKSLEMQTVDLFLQMEVDWGRVLGAFFGFLLSIPAVFISLTIRFSLSLDKHLLLMSS